MITSELKSEIQETQTKIDKATQELNNANSYINSLRTPIDIICEYTVLQQNVKLSVNKKRKEIEEIKLIEKIDPFKKYDIYNKRELYFILNLFLLSDKRPAETIKIILEKYSENLAENVFTIKRAGDYSQIYYCTKKNEKEDYIYASNDRMSASFCYINKVNFIGSFSDSAIFINFNKKIEKNIPASPSIYNQKNNINYYRYYSLESAPDISKYIKYIQIIII